MTSRRRTCYLHIGTHRTGTTSTQRILSRHAADLERHGFVYPSIGRPPEAPAGHHNLAWEISGDRRFRPEYGAAADLLDAINDSPHDVILSSEDFECSLFHAEGFDAFVRLLTANHLAVTVIVGLRNQVDYAQSLYDTMLHFAIPDAFEAFVSKVVEDGRFSHREWIFPFCYRTLLARLEAIEEVAIVVRSYDRSPYDSVVDDYLSVLGLSPAALDIDTNLRAAARTDLVASLGIFCQNGKGRPLDRSEERAVARLCASMGTARPRIADRSRRRIVERFRESNDYVRARYGIDVAGAAELVDGTDASRDAPVMEVMFSDDFRRRVDRLSLQIQQEPPNLGT